MTTTLFSLVCLNLPPEERYQARNMHPFCFFPGKLNTEQLNHILMLLVDELLHLWSPGVFYTETSLRPQGRLVKAALCLLVCDTPVARCTAGFAGHASHNNPCMMCKITQRGWENQLETDSFELQTAAEWRAHANEWKMKTSKSARDASFRSTGVQWSELL